MNGVAHCGGRRVVPEHPHVVRLRSAAMSAKMDGVPGTARENIDDCRTVPAEQERRPGGTRGVGTARAGAPHVVDEVAWIFENLAPAWTQEPRAGTGVSVKLQACIVHQEAWGKPLGEEIRSRIRRTLVRSERVDVVDVRSATPAPMLVGGIGVFGRRLHRELSQCRTSSCGRRAPSCSGIPPHKRRLGLAASTA